MASEAVKIPSMELNDGNKIPILGLGTSGSDEDIAKMRQAINWAIEAGYRHIDTATLYRNEKQIGEGIADVVGKGIVKRDDLFITTKLWSDRHARDQVVLALRESLQRLGLDYVDLYLVHFPVAKNDDGSCNDIDYLETWKGMEDVKKLGLTKSIGISNFNSEQIDRLLANCEIKPAVNQIEVHPSLTQEYLVPYCQKFGIVVESYSPFGFFVQRRQKSVSSAPSFDDPTLVAIAQKYGKTTSQVILRYLIDRGTVVIPKSTNKERMIQNMAVFDFSLTEDEISAIHKLNRNLRYVDCLDCKHHYYYPFNKD